MTKNVLILHSAIAKDAAPDEEDVVIQAHGIEAALERLGVKTSVLPFPGDISLLRKAILDQQASLVFNLVETIDGQVRFCPMAAAMLDLIKVPYTGCSATGLFLTTDKVLCKRMMLSHGIPTAPWVTQAPSPGESFEAGKKYIVKTIFEDGSIGLSDASVGGFRELGALRSAILDASQKIGLEYFAEQYIDGREFSIALIGSADPRQALVLPVMERRFENYPADKPKIYTYTAKWEHDSFEYNHAKVSCEISEKDGPLTEKMKQIALKCWEVFSLSGYARVDFRVDSSGAPWVLEVNANPCLAPDATIMIAMQKASLSFDNVIELILSHPVCPLAPSSGAVQGKT